MPKDIATTGSHLYPQPSAAAAPVVAPTADKESDDLHCDEKFNEADLRLAPPTAASTTKTPDPLNADMKTLIRNIASYWDYEIKINAKKEIIVTDFCINKPNTSLENYLTKVMQYLISCYEGSFEQLSSFKNYLREVDKVVREYFECIQEDFPHNKNICFIFGIIMRGFLEIYEIDHPSNPLFLVCSELINEKIKTDINTITYLNNLELKLTFTHTKKTITNIGNKWDGIKTHIQPTKPEFSILDRLHDIVDKHLPDSMTYIQIQFYLIKVDKILDAYLLNITPTNQLVLEVLVTSLIMLLESHKIELDYVGLRNFCEFKLHTFAELTVKLVLKINVFDFDHGDCDEECEKYTAAHNVPDVIDAKSELRAASSAMSVATTSTDQSATAAAAAAPEPEISSPPWKKRSVGNARRQISIFAVIAANATAANRNMPNLSMFLHKNRKRTLDGAAVADEPIATSAQRELKL